MDIQLRGCHRLLQSRHKSRVVDVVELRFQAAEFVLRKTKHRVAVAVASSYVYASDKCPEFIGKVEMDGDLGVVFNPANDQGSLEGCT